MNLTKTCRIDKNYHTHTVRCHHAQGSEREYIEAAIKKGMRTLGFSDHTPQPFKDGYVSSIRMVMDELDDYVGTVRALSEEYRGRIDIMTGLEVEYYQPLFDELMREISLRPIEYMILGQHFVPEEGNGFYAGNPTDSEERLAEYVNVVIRGLETGLFSYLAHPDLLNFTGDPLIYRREMERLCEYCRDKKVPLEINMLGYITGRHYPNDEFFSLASELGCSFILGCDAHSPSGLLQPWEIPGFTGFLKRNRIEYSQEMDIRLPAYPQDDVG
ncbi:MAG TPA: hypothetical protein DCL38_03340 [Lachnospiraceae bacterium]|nr:hypothetical protein [Lachnospiraceae bacterium]